MDPLRKGSGNHLQPALNFQQHLDREKFHMLLGALSITVCVINSWPIDQLACDLLKARAENHLVQHLLDLEHILHVQK